MKAWTNSFRLTPAWARCGLAVILGAPLLVFSQLPFIVLISSVFIGLVLFIAGYSGVKWHVSERRSPRPPLWTAWIPMALEFALIAAVSNLPEWNHYFRENDWTYWIHYGPVALQLMIGAELVVRSESRESMAILGALGGALALAAIAPIALVLALGGL